MLYLYVRIVALSEDMVFIIFVSFDLIGYT